MVRRRCGSPEPVGTLNDNWPVDVELIVVYSEALDRKLGALEASEWFAQRNQYLRDFPEDLETFRWEWFPGMPEVRPQFRYRSGARSVIIFVSYDSPGSHRARVTPPNQHLRLDLRSADFKVEAR